MSSAPRRRDQPAEPPRRSVAAAFLDEHRAGLATALVLAASAGAAVYGWGVLGGRVRSGVDQVLHPEAIAVEGIAPWVRDDLRLEALRDASLADGVPLDDPELARRLARAFDMHPWVHEVLAVEVRHPAAAVIRVRCREPVAMVVVPGGLLAVDADGVVLPSEDFTAEAAAGYPRVTGITSGPRAAVGAAWGDPLVEQAAALAAAIGPDWPQLGFVECRPAAGTDPAAWQLVGAGGRTVVFGSAPGHERPGEPSAAAKISRLRSLPADADGVDLAAPGAG
ncbi:MAG: hypothetical protein FJ275_05500 [Planctomycetes bacterium]|nr:hypothetical protein [Planctomycetota bacterium]